MSVLGIIGLIAFAIIVLLRHKDADNNIIDDADSQAPVDWEKWQQVLDANTLPHVKVRLINELPTKIDQSKFGGTPYWPQGRDYPKGVNGDPLFFLAQINFSDFSHNVDAFPKQGLLQFFVSLEGGLFGLEHFNKKENLANHLNSHKKNHAVIYHAEISEPVTSFGSDVVSVLDSDESPQEGESALQFSSAIGLPTPEDYRVRKLIEPLGRMNDEINEYFSEYLSVDIPAHQIGGYATFAQGDPRSGIAEDEQWLLLFQMDTDSNDHFNIMWGDAGIANFFIRKSDLTELNFDRVWFSWDCG